MRNEFALLVVLLHCTKHQHPYPLPRLRNFLGKTLKTREEIIMSLYLRQLKYIGIQVTDI